MRKTEENDKITARQLAAMGFVSVFSPMIRLLPKVPVERGGKAAWLSPLAAAVPALLLVLLLNALMERRKEGEGLAAVICRCVGKKAGKSILVLYLLWMLFYGGFILRTAAERLLSSVYTNGGIGIFVTVTILIAAVAALGRLRSLARTAEVFLGIITTVVVLSLLFSLADFDARRLLPVTARESGDVLRGAIPVANVMSVVVYFSFLSGRVTTGQEEGKFRIRQTLCSLIIAFFLMAITVGTLSAEIAAKKQHPFFVMIQNISVLGVIERIEAIVVALWILTDFIYLSALLKVSEEIFLEVCACRKQCWFIPVTAAIMLAVSVILAGSAFGVKDCSERIVPALNIFFTFGLVPALFLIGKVRKKL